MTEDTVAAARGPLNEGLNLDAECAWHARTIAQRIGVNPAEWMADAIRAAEEAESPVS